MQVPAFCCRLALNVLLLLPASSSPEAAVVQLLPDRLQFFEYESIGFSCEGPDGSAWRVKRRLKGFDTICASSWETSAGPCTIQHAFVADSGEYWCQGTGGKRSRSVSVTVTAGSVILESPARPVEEGTNVTLRCRGRQTSSVLPAAFYKDGFFMENSPRGEISISGILKSDEGRYRCHISGAGDSPESSLSVTAGSVPPVSRDLLVLHEATVMLTCTKTTESGGDVSSSSSDSVGEMVVSRVSASDEGLYKCSFSGAGGLEESWLNVRASATDPPPSSDRFLYGFMALRVFGTVLLVFLGLMVQRVHRRKPTAASPSFPPTTVSCKDPSLRE